MQQQVRWHAMADAAAMLAAARDAVLGAAQAAIAARGSFHIVLAGGNTPRALYQGLRNASTDWSVWQVWYGDERCAPPRDAERNSRMAAEAWLDHVPIPAAQVHAMPAELGADEAARRYALELQSVGDFDLVLLGLGEDGHTASLFPGHDWGAAPGSPDVLAVTQAPKPPPERVSLSAARLSRARQVLFLVSGESKRDAMRAWRSGADIPARAVSPPAGVDVMADAALLASPAAP